MKLSEILYTNETTLTEGFRLKSKFDVKEIAEENGIDNEELLDGFIYWLDITEVEEMIVDFMNDRDVDLEEDDTFALSDKFDVKEIAEENGVETESLLDGFIYWMDVTNVEKMIVDFMNDRDVDLEED